MTARAALSFEEIQRIAEEKGARYPGLVAAQYQLESGGGKYLSGSNNPFGIKDPGGTVKTTQEVVNGKTITTQAGFKNFGSTEEAIQHLVDRWYKDYKGYKGVNNAPDLASAARMLKEQGYATDPNYASKLIKIAGGGGGTGSAAPQSAPAAASPLEAGPLVSAAPVAAAPAALPRLDAESSTAVAGLLGGLGLDPATAVAGTALIGGLGRPASEGRALVDELASGPAGQAAASSGRKAGSFNVIEYLTGDKSHPGYRDDHGGANYHEHLAFGSKAERDAAMAKLKAAGIQIGSVNDGTHSPTSYHYQELAFDVPAAQVPVGQEPALSRRVREILGIG